jgi:hypothetical protein
MGQLKAPVHCCPRFAICPGLRRWLVVRCDVLCGSVTVKRPDWLMRRREERLAAKERSQLPR